MTSGGGELARVMYTRVPSCVRGPRRVFFFLREGALESLLCSASSRLLPEKKKTYLTLGITALENNYTSPLFFFFVL